MKQHSTKKTGCSALNLKNGITILNVVVIFLLFISLGATAHANKISSAPDKTNSVNTPPPSCVAGFTFTPADLVAYFTSTSTDTNASTEYRWQFGDGGVSHLKNPTHRYATGGNYTACLTIINTALSCSDSVCHTVTITQCQAAFDTVVTNSVLTVTSTSTGVDGNTVYDWSFGDGGIGHITSLSHTYTTPGTYTVCLTISNTVTGCSSQFCENVIISPFVSTCAASFDTSVIANQLTVTSTSTGVDANTNYTWNFGDGGIGHQATQSHTYAPTIKICSVPVTLTNTIDTASSTGLQVMITVNSATYTADETTGLQNVEFTTGSLGTGTPLQAWIESGATTTSTNTIYWVNLASNIIPANGTLTIYMNFMPSNVMSAAGPTGESSMLSATYGQYDNGALVFPNIYTAWGGLSGGSVPSGISIIGSPYITNNPDYTAYVLNPNDCCTPDVLYYTNTPASAQGTTVMETYCSIDGAYMWWGTNDGQGDGDAPGIIVSWDAGCITPDYSMKDGGNCYDLLTPVSTTPYIWTIELANNNYVTAIDNNYTQVLGPQATDQSVANPAYFGYFGTTQNDGYGGNDEADIYWTRTRIYPPGGVLPSVSFGPIACHGSTKYDVCLTISNTATGCYSTTCDSVAILYFTSTCTAAFSASTDDFLATFTNSSTGTDINTTYDWNFGDGGVSHEQSPIHLYSVPGTYTTCLTIKNPKTGCYDSVCNEVTITPCQSAFTASVNDNTITVTSTSTGTDANTVYDWTFGDGSIGHQQSQSHTYAAPSTTVCGIPVTLTNTQSTATPNGFQQMLTINSSAYSSSESAGLENVEFSTGPEGEGTILQAWAESGASNSSTSTVWWVNLGSTTIPVNGTLTIYMNFMPSNVMSPTGPSGEAPQLSATYAQYDNGALVFPGSYAAWGGLSGGNVPANISTTGSPGVTNNATYTELNFNNCCSAQGAYYTTTPASAETYPTVLESYNSMQGYYMWYGTGNGYEEGGTGVVICYDYPGFSSTDFGIKSDNQNYQDITSAALTSSPVIWSIVIQDTVTLNSILENYNQVLGSETIYATAPQYYGFFGTDQNGGNNLADVYWTRTRAYPPGGVMPTGTLGTSITCAPRGTYNVCLTISNTATGCNSITCQNVVVGPVSTCQAGFKDSTSDLEVYFTDTSGGTNGNTTYYWNFGDGSISKLQNPDHRYSGAGTYTACLTIQNPATNCFDSVCHEITITQCQASFDTSLVGDKLTVTSTSTGIDPNTVYTWNFGDGGIGHDSSQTHTYNPYATICSVPITLTNNQSTATNSNFQQMIVINSSTYSSEEQPGLQNVEFTTGTGGSGTPLQAWIESGDSASSTNTIYWVNLGSNTIPANGTLTIYMTFMSASVLSATGPTGEAPQLSTPYGQYDNGALVFPGFYDNFAGTTLSSNWTNTGAAGVTVSNGLTLTYNGPNWYGIYTNTFSSALNTVAESYCSATSTNGQGVCINASGTNGNGINNGNDGIDAQLAGPSGSQYMFGGGGSATSAPNANLTLANASPADNTYYLLSFFMTSTPVMQLNYGAFTTLTCTPDGDDISANSEVGLGVSGSNGSFQWFRDRAYPPNGVMPMATEAALSCQAITKYNVCLTISNSKTGCSSTTCDSVTIVPFTCAASFDTVVVGNRLTVTSTSTGIDDSTKYSWSFGDGGVGHDSSQSHLYTASPTNICYVPITLTNNQSTATSAGFDQMVIVNSSTYSADEQSGLQNVEFMTGSAGSGTPLQSWIESGNSSSATNTVYWVNLGSNTISANGTLTIYMTFMPASVLSAIGPAGEAPQLSTTYGQYDNGSLVFPAFYDNFAGASLNTTSNWTIAAGGSTPTVNNLLTLTSVTDVNWWGIYTQNTNLLGSVVDAYVESPNEPQGVAIATNGLAYQFMPDLGNLDYGTGGSVTSNPTGQSDGGGSCGYSTWYTFSAILNNSAPIMDINYNNSSLGGSEDVAGSSLDNLMGSNTPVGLGVSGTTLGGAPGYYEYVQWFRDRTSPPNGVMPAATETSMVCTNTFDVCLTISNGKNGCSSTTCESVTLLPLVDVCGANFTETSNGTLAQFTSTSTDTTTATKYDWNFGDDSISHQVNPQHTYLKQGRYEVCLTITDSTESFCDSTMCDSITIISPVSVCGPSFTAAAGTKLLEEEFISTSTDTTTATKYDWNFGDDSISHQRNPQHIYKKAGTYKVCLTITDSTLSYCDSTYCDSVKVTLPASECTADFTWVNVKGQGIHFYSDSKDTTTATQYSWNLGDGTVLQNEVDPSHRYAQSGTYYVCLTITDNTETYCNSTFCDSVPFVLTGIDDLSFPGTSLYYDEASSQLVLNWVGNDNVAIHLVDILGRDAQDIYMGNLSTGTYRFAVNSSFVASGIYFVHITAADGNRTLKIFVLPH